MNSDMTSGRGRRSFLFGGADPPPPPAGPVAGIAGSCLASKGVACMICRDACPAGAIRVVLALGGARPRVEAEACIGCAECVPVCPVHAIAMTGPFREGTPGA